MDKQTANRIVDAAMRDGGGTFSPTGEAVFPESGYAVGVSPGTWFKTHSVTQASEAVREMSLIMPDVHVGIWLDRSFIHIDPVVIVSDFDEAVSLGRNKLQVGIYDFAKGQTILL